MFSPRLIIIVSMNIIHIMNKEIEEKKSYKGKYQLYSVLIGKENYVLQSWWWLRSAH